MIFFKKPDQREIQLEKLYDHIVTASRHQDLYTSYGIEDSITGRFDTLALHTILVLQALKNHQDPAPEIAQNLIDLVFERFDVALRELGVGDTVVPKRMKKMAESFYGSANAYEKAMQDKDSITENLEAALLRNIEGTNLKAKQLALYVKTSTDNLARQSWQSLMQQGPDFAKPASDQA